jgi:hypothetical protein
LLVEHYIFGDKYLSAQLRLDALNELHRLLTDVDQETLPGADTVGLAFRTLPAESPMCRYLVEAHCYWFDPDNESELEHYNDCVPFLLGVWRRNAQLLKNDLKPRDNYTIDICDFHKHADEDEKKVCKKGEASKKGEKVPAQPEL